MVWFCVFGGIMTFKPILNNTELIDWTIKSEITDVPEISFLKNKWRKHIDNRIQKQLNHAAHQQKEEKDKKFTVYDGSDLISSRLNYKKLYQIKGVKHYGLDIQVQISPRNDLIIVKESKKIFSLSLQIKDQEYQGSLFGESEIFDFEDRKCLLAERIKINSNESFGEEALQEALQGVSFWLDRNCPETKENHKRLTAFLIETKTSPICSETITIFKRECGIAYAEGARSNYQDAYLATSFKFKEEDVCLYGVFDGHGTDGEKASIFVRDNLKEFLSKALEYYNEQEITDEGLWNAFKVTPVWIRDYFPMTPNGTTAVICIIFREKIWILNVGDSRAVLLENGEAIQLSEDAKVSNPRYAKKCKKQGFWISLDHRINGALNVARVIGNKHLKAFVEGEFQGGVSAEPKITWHKINKQSDKRILILGSDGLFDVVSTNQVVKVMDKWNAEGVPPEKMAKLLVKSAIECSGSRDNVTAMIVKI